MKVKRAKGLARTCDSTGIYGRRSTLISSTDSYHTKQLYLALIEEEATEQGAARPGGRAQHQWRD